ncbi:MAG: hypothetical protein M1820_000476 [Bogoriella megaspora]|nr:MAG: hypothetical protein M1820_000476 [Bogoriella megaspora]
MVFGSDASKDILIAALTASLAHLGFAYSKEQSNYTAPNIPIVQNGVFDKRQPSIAANLETVQKRKSMRRYAISALEGISLVASANTAWTNQKSESSTIDVYFWSYLIVLYIVGPMLQRRLTRLRLSVRQNSALLYLVRWLAVISTIYTQLMYESRLESLPRSDIHFVATTTLLLLNVLVWPRSLPSERAEYPDATRESYSSLLGALSFAWVDDFLLTGWYQNKLTLDQIPTLPLLDAAAPSAEAFQRSGKEPSNLTSRIFRHFRTLLILQAVWACVHGIFSFMPTLLLQSILERVEQSDKVATGQAWSQVAILFLCSVLASIAESRSIWIGQKIGFRLRSIMISEIYAKALRRPCTTQEAEGSSENKQRTQADVGTILNFLGTDAFKIADAGANMHQVWGSVPVQVTVALILLYRTLGVSIIPGVALMASMVPINSRIAQRFGAVQSQVMAASDGRIQSMSEMVRSIRVVKFFAWESHFEQTIKDQRAKELRALRARYILWSIAASIWYGMPPLITFVSFFSYAVVLKHPLTPSLAFTSLSLFNLLKMPLDDFVGMIGRIQDTLSSVRRIEQFLQEEDTDKYNMLDQGVAKDSSLLGFERATFRWGDSFRQSADFGLEDLNLSFAIGKLNIINGPTGSGKSSMLLALLGEMKLVQGSVFMPGGVDRDSLKANPKTGLINSVAYCAQEAWLTNNTIRNNIVFGSPYGEERYKAVLDACALGLDLQALPDGDLTRVGERGVSLSGGQKQRVALARAVYSNAYHLLLDDCLGAVDSHTAAWILRKCLKGPLVNGRTVILATHDLVLAGSDADFVVVLRQGKVIESGSTSEIERSAAHPPLEGLVKKGNEDPDSESSIVSLPSSMRPISLSKASLEIIQQDIADGFDEQSSQSEENTVNNPVPWRSIFQYFQAMGGRFFWLLLILAFVGQQFAAIATNWWVRVLCNAYVEDAQRTATFPERPQGISISFYFGMYALIIGLFLIVGLVRLLVISYGSLNASSSIHKGLTKNIVNATFAFFDKTSFGQIINCFSRDLQTVDQDLAVLAVAALHFYVAVAGIIILIVIITPAFLVPGIIIAIAYYIIGAIYIVGTRNMKQVESAQRAPLFQHFSETLSGITTIRAYGVVGQYRVGNQIRIDKANRPSFFLAATERWLTFRLGLVGAIVSLSAGSFATSAGGLNSGAIGLSMSYAIVFSEHVLWLIRYHMANMQNEAPAVIKNVDLKTGWPSKGAVQYESVSARYSSSSDPVLREVSFTASPLERVGLVGRTGAGKSSLVLTLLRGLEIDGGHIKIDGVDTKKIGLRDLRRKLAIVPQDPVLFAETLKYNLDPLNQHSDQELLAALESVGLYDPEDASDKIMDSAVHQNRFSDLSLRIAESGSNISQGQRQLVCIARALLKAPKVVILDEATTSTDHQTELKIQESIRKLDATIITVAHRLGTVIDYDKIVVLDGGEVKECDHPWKLLQDKHGIFHGMCKAASDSENLTALAQAAWDSDRRTRFQKRVS